MASALVGSAFSVVGKALSPLTDGLLKDWAATNKLGSNVKDLELELLAAQALLEDTSRKEIVDNKALEKLLAMLQGLAYDADDVLDELDYFRIQDQLDGTFEAADEHAKGCAQNLALNVRHTAKAVGKRIWLPACLSPGAKPRPEARNSDDTISSPPHANLQQANAGAWRAQWAQGKTHFKSMLQHHPRGALQRNILA